MDEGGAEMLKLHTDKIKNRKRGGVSMRKFSLNWKKEAGRAGRLSNLLLGIALVLAFIAAVGLCSPTTAQAGTISSCGDCHGNGPVDSSTRDGATGRFPGSHNTHWGTYQINCEICHVAPNYTWYSHQSDAIQVNLRWYSMATGVVRAGSVNGWGSYSKWTSFPMSNNPTFGNCANTYCHSKGIGGSVNMTMGQQVRPIAPNISPMWSTVPTGCHACHGNETGNPGNGAPWYTNGYQMATKNWGSFKANSHQAHAPSGGVCYKCHYATTTTGTSITSIGSHIKMNYTVVPGPGITYTYAWASDGGTCSTVSCHGNGNMKWGTGVGPDCIGCHSSSFAKTLGGGGNIRNVTGAGGDFTMASRHLLGTTYTTIFKWDCIVCHMEGWATTTSVGKTSALHNEVGGKIDVRNADNWTSYWSIDNRAWTTLDYANMDLFCVSCHDADGAAGINVNTTNNGVNLTNARALQPFNTTDYVAGSWGTVKGSTWHSLTGGQRTRVTNVKDQFYAGTGGAGAGYNGNPSQHAVLGQRYSTKNASWITAAWSSYLLKKTRSNLQGDRETALLTCADCHVLDTGGGAHGGTTKYNLWGSITGGPMGICTRCHSRSTYDAGSGTGTGSRFYHGYNRSAYTAYGIAGGGSNMPCLVCHAGWRTTPASGGGYYYGGIHGTGWNSSWSTFTTKASSAVTAYRFFPGTGRIGNIWTNSNDGQWTTNTSYDCYFVAISDQFTSCNKHSTTGGAIYTPTYGRPVKY